MLRHEHDNDGEVQHDTNCCVHHLPLADERHPFFSDFLKISLGPPGLGAREKLASDAKAPKEDQSSLDVSFSAKRLRWTCSIILRFYYHMS